jgi:SAM-dependent methyltransferase
VRDVIARIPKEGLSELMAKHGDVEVKGWDYKKYLMIDQHMERAARQAITLGLQHPGPKRVLDLGCGSGYFLFVARHLGHEVMGLDMPDNKLFNDTMALLAIRRIDHQIKPYTPMPDFGMQLDVITGHQVWFNWTGRADPWSNDEWKYFLDDCRSRLASGGHIRFELNPGRDKICRFLTEDTAGFLRQYPGATVSADKSVVEVKA